MFTFEGITRFINPMIFELLFFNASKIFITCKKKINRSYLNRIFNSFKYLKIKIKRIYKEE